MTDISLNKARYSPPPSNVSARRNISLEGIVKTYHHHWICDAAQTLVAIFITYRITTGLEHV